VARSAWTSARACAPVIQRLVPSAAAERLPLLHGFTRLHIDRAQVAVDRLQPIAVIDHHAIPIDPQVIGVNHLSVIGGCHRNMEGHR